MGLVFHLPASVTLVVKGMLRDIMAPYQSLTAGIGARLRKPFDDMRRRRDLADALTAAETELRSLRLDLQRLSAVNYENIALRRQLGYVARSSIDLVPCRVIARGDMSGWWRTLRVNRGAAAGIEPAMAVVSERGLVGQILETSLHTSEVLLISDASSRVSVRVLPSGTPGILQGAPTHFHRRAIPDLLLPAATFGADYLTLQGDVREGDEVVTSGLGSVFPAGLPVGNINGIRVDGSDLYRRAVVRPRADLMRLDTLYIVRAPQKEALP